MGRGVEIGDGVSGADTLATRGGPLFKVHEVMKRPLATQVPHFLAPTTIAISAHVPDSHACPSWRLTSVIMACF